MSPTSTDGLDDFFEAVKDARDRVNVYASGKSFMGMLDAHEDMRRRQRLRDIAEAATQTNSLQRQANQLEKQRLDLLESESFERRWEAERRAALPVCPDCQSKIEGNKPAKCAACGSLLFWFGDTPLNQAVCESYLQEPCTNARVTSAIDNVREAGAGIKQAVDNSVGTIAPSEMTYESLLQQCKRKQDDWLQAREAKLREVDNQRSKVRAADAEANKQAREISEKGDEAIFVRMGVLLAVGAILFLLTISWLAGPGGEVVPRIVGFLLFLGLPVALFFGWLGIGRFLFARVEAKASQVRRANEFQKLLTELESSRDAISSERAPAATETAMQLVAAHEKLNEALAAASGCQSQWAQMARSIEQADKSEIGALRAAVEQAQSLLTQDIPLMLATRAAATLPTRADAESDTADVGQAKDLVNDMATMLMEGLCVVAAVDGSLRTSEIEVISRAVQQAGCPLLVEELRTMAIVACKRIHGSGAMEYAVELCQQWESFRGSVFARLLLRLQKQVVEADGRYGLRERRLIELFQTQLS